MRRGFIDDKRQWFARHLRGDGLEIGALQHPMPLAHANTILYSDILTAEQLERSYPGSKPPDIVSDSESFPTIANDRFDFIVANHVLEHLSSPIRALKEWFRILRDDGLLLMAIPDKRFTFDRGRQRTPLTHLIADSETHLPAHELNKCHLLEWAEHVEHLTPGSAAFDRWVAQQVEQGYSVHNHVWVAQDVLEMLHWMNQQQHVRFELEEWCNSSPLRAEILLLVRARKRARALEGTSYQAARWIARLSHPPLQLCAVAMQLITSMRRSRVSSEPTMKERDGQR